MKNTELKIERLKLRAQQMFEKIKTTEERVSELEDK